MMRTRLPAALACVAGLSLLVSVSAEAAPKKKAKAKTESAEASKKSDTDDAPAASGQKKSVAFGPITGAKPKEVRDWVRVVLDEEFELTDAEDFKAKNDAAYVKMGKDLGVDFIVVGKLEQNRLVLSVRSAKDGKVVREIELKGPRGPKLKKSIATDLAPAITEAVGQKPSAPPPPKKKPVDEDLAEEEETEEEEEEATEEEGEPEEGAAEEGSEEAPAEAESEPSAPAGPTAEPLIAAAGLRLYRRSLTFNDTLPPPNLVRPLRNYTLRLGPSLFLRAQFYPAVLLGGEGFVTNVGLIGGFEKGIATTSRYTGDNASVPAELTNDLQEWYVGLRARVPSATSEFGFVGAYGRHDYRLKGDESQPTIPDVSYGYIKLGADGRILFGNFSVGAHFGGRLLLSTGDLEDYWFENAAGMALDAGLSAGYRVIEPLTILVGFDFVRYGLDFNPVPPTAVAVAGGATDQYVSGWIGAQFALPGRAQASASAGAASD